MGKQKRVSFTKVAKKLKKEQSEMVRTNVWELSPLSSLY